MPNHFKREAKIMAAIFPIVVAIGLLAGLVAPQFVGPIGRNSTLADSSGLWKNCAGKDDDPEGIDRRISACTVILESSGESSEHIAAAHYNRGIAYGVRGDRRREILDYDMAIEAKPDFEAAFNNRGLAYKNLRDFGQALRDFDEAIRLKPGDLYALNNRASILVGLKAYTDALKVYEEEIRLAPDWATSYASRARAYREMKDYARVLANRCETRAIVNRDLKAALADCDAALALEPGKAEALTARALVYVRLERYRQAIEDCGEALQHDPTSADALFIRGLAKRRLSSYADGNVDLAAAEANDHGIAEKFGAYDVRL
jgi:tetratricopeptide (TPR) repeat protein